MLDIDKKTIDRFQAACHKAGAMGLVRCSSGNLSLRLDSERMIISASRSWLAELTREQVSLCRIADATCLAGPRPSVETVFHAGILRDRPDRNVVLHFQTPCATTLACGDLAGVNFNVIPEVPVYMGPIGIVEYLPPGSSELAAAVIAAMGARDLAILRNHGQVTVGVDFDDAIQKAAFFELACEIILRAGPRLTPLTPQAVKALKPGAKA